MPWPVKVPLLWRICRKAIKAHRMPPAGISNNWFPSRIGTRTEARPRRSADEGHGADRDVIATAQPGGGRHLLQPRKRVEVRGGGRVGTGAGMIGRGSHRFHGLDGLGRLEFGHLRLRFRERNSNQDSNQGRAIKSGGGVERTGFRPGTRPLKRTARAVRFERVRRRPRLRPAGPGRPVPSTRRAPAPGHRISPRARPLDGQSKGAMNKRQLIEDIRKYNITAQPHSSSSSMRRR